MFKVSNETLGHFAEVSIGNRNSALRDVSNLVSLRLTSSTIGKETECYFSHDFMCWVIAHLERSDEAI